MRHLGSVIVFVVMFSLLWPISGVPADDAKVKEGMSQSSGAPRRYPSSQSGTASRRT